MDQMLPGGATNPWIKTCPGPLRRPSARRPLGAGPVGPEYGPGPPARAASLDLVRRPFLALPRPHSPIISPALVCSIRGFESTLQRTGPGDSFKLRITI